MSISSSDGLSGSLSKSSCFKMMWQVEQDNVPSQAPEKKISFHGYKKYA